MSPAAKQSRSPSSRGAALSRWRGHAPTAARREQLDWVRQLRPDVKLMTSVCTGSLVYAAAGLLSGRPATTHWAALDELSKLDAGGTPRNPVRPRPSV